MATLARETLRPSRGMFACLLPCVRWLAYCPAEEPWAAEKRRQATRDAIRYLEVAGVTVVEVRFLGAFLRAPCAKSAASAEDREFRAVLTLEFFKLRRETRG